MRKEVLVSAFDLNATSSVEMPNFELESYACKSYAFYYFYFHVYITWNFTRTPFYILSICSIAQFCGSVTDLHDDKGFRFLGYLPALMTPNSHKSVQGQPWERRVAEDSRAETTRPRNPIPQSLKELQSRGTGTMGAVG